MELQLVVYPNKCLQISSEKVFGVVVVSVSIVLQNKGSTVQPNDTHETKKL